MERRTDKRISANRNFEIEKALSRRMQMCRAASEQLKTGIRKQKRWFLKSSGPTYITTVKTKASQPYELTVRQ